MIFFPGWKKNSIHFNWCISDLSLPTFMGEFSRQAKTSDQFGARLCRFSTPIVSDRSKQAETLTAPFSAPDGSKRHGRPIDEPAGDCWLNGHQYSKWTVGETQESTMKIKQATNKYKQMKSKPEPMSDAMYLTLWNDDGSVKYGPRHDFLASGSGERSEIAVETRRGMR